MLIFCYIKCTDRSIKAASVNITDENAAPTITAFDKVTLEDFQNNIVEICELSHAMKLIFERVLYLNEPQHETSDDLF